MGSKVVTASPLAECFLLDWSIQSPLATTSQVETLDVENQAGVGGVGISGGLSKLELACLLSQSPCLNVSFF